MYPASQRGLHFSKALFVPPDSNLKSLAKGGGSRDLGWHHRMATFVNAGAGRFGPGQAVWPPVLAAQAAARADAPRIAPEDGRATGPSEVADGPGVALPSIASAMDWLRSRARGVGPAGRVHVLVTGSLYLVGDVLRALGRLA